MDALYPLILILPLLGAALVGLLGLAAPAFRRNEGLIGAIATAMVAIPFFLILMVFLGISEEAKDWAIHFELLSWMEAGNLQILFSYRLDQLSILMGLVVTGVGSLIHLYSMGYMKGDPGYYKYFAYLNLFIFSMNNLILGDNLVVMFLGWEGVGLCSYLLIGFWYTDMPKAKAAQKAFVANRIGDFAMLVAMFIIFRELATDAEGNLTQLTQLSFGEILAHDFGESTKWIALLVFIAATGKSAQIPLFVWLPDAMAGPTPVSALIHAATMVTSGIYLTARLHPVFSAAPEVLSLIVIVAALTAIVAAFTAIAQNDIKKVLAYSTVSQLGFMFMALGAGAYTTAIFHVVTHAFFKACLFLGSGSVIHAMEHMHTVDDPQDIRTMGGLRKYLPATGTTFWISTLAISGIVPLSGFFSKDEIMASLFFFGEGFDLYKVIYIVAMFTALLTAFYMTRVTVLTFEGTERFPDTKKPHESPAIMTIPLWILAGLAVFGGLMGIPHFISEELNWIDHHWLGQMITNHEWAHPSKALEWGLMGLSAAIAIGTVLITRNYYLKNGLEGDVRLRTSLGNFYQTMADKFYFDELYDAIIIRPFNALAAGLNWFDEVVIDGIVKGISEGVGNVGDVFKRMQTGLVSNYLVILSIGVIAMLTFLVFG